MRPHRTEEEEEEEEEGGQRAMQEKKIHGTEEEGGEEGAAEECRRSQRSSFYRCSDFGQAKINSSNFAAGSKISNGLHSRLLNRRRRKQRREWAF